MPLNGIHHVELYVGNALQAAYYFARAFGFRRVAYRGLETGTRDQVSHVLQQGRIRLVLTGALHSASPIAAHQHKHGDGVKDIALRVPSVDDAYREATSRGATRSEEHTSELQSQFHLVCRLLLEKKKQKHIRHLLHSNRT